MIRYALACEQAHEFESWFRSSADFDAQAKQGFVSCPLCGSAKIAKQIMAPRLARTDKSDEPAPAPSQEVALIADKEQALRAALKQLREQVEQNAENVGKNFAEEARKIHYGETEQRSIFGEASPEEARALKEEGVEFHPLPILPDDRN